MSRVVANEKKIKSSHDATTTTAMLVCTYNKTKYNTNHMNGANLHLLYCTVLHCTVLYYMLPS